MENVNTSTAHMYISNPIKKKKRANWFSTHPPIADRIEALRKIK